MKKPVRDLTLTALFLALGILFPMMFHMFGLGSAFLPMHIPVLLCGLIVGWKYGAACGLIVPVLSSVMTGMPPLFPTAVAMMFELCAYGLLTGLFYRKTNVYFSLIGAMLGGRLISGAANAILLGATGASYGFMAFITASFVTSLPGIIIQLIFVPLVVLVLNKANLVRRPA